MGKRTHLDFKSGWAAMPAETNQLSFQPVGCAYWAHSQRDPAPANARFLVYPAVYQYLVYALTTALTCQR